MTRIMTPFDDFPKEGALIGRLLAGYGELEYTLCLMVGVNLNNEDMAFKAMFRPRGETVRIDIADALGRGKFRDLNLETHFSEAISAMRFCLKIRNTYSHCNWYNDNTGKLGFVELEEIAIKNQPIHTSALTVKHVDPPLLTEQLDFFSFVDDCFRYLNFEGRKRAGKSSIPKLSAPKKVARPPLYIP